MNAPLIEAHAALPWSEDSRARLDWSHQGNGAVLLIGPDKQRCRDYLRMLGGVEPPREGRLRLLGRDLESLPIEQWRELRTEVGFVTHGAPLLSVLNALDNVMLPLLYHRKADRPEAMERAQALLRQLGFEGDTSQLPAYYTELQRLQLAIARSLILKPQLLMLESLPMDPEAHEREAILEFLQSGKRRATLLLSTGNLYFTKHLADSILFIDEQQVLHFDSWAAFIDSEQPSVHDYLQRRREQMQIF